MKKRPGIQKAVHYLTHGVETGAFRQKLPTIKSLAKAADVSFVTMWKAVDQLRRKGMLSRENLGRAGGRRDKSAPAPPAAMQAPAVYPDIEQFEPVWQKMLARFKQDVLTGRFPAGQPLPSCKELQGMYGVSYPTLRKALETLSSQEIIRPHQRGYIAPALTKSESTVRIVAIGCGWEDGTLWIDYQDKNYFRILESECIQSKVALDIVVYCRQGDRLCFIDTITRKPYDLSNDNILSIIMIVANLEIPPEEVIKKIVGYKKPVAVLDVVGGWEASARTASNYYLQLFTVTMSIRPPRSVAQYLLTLGHKNVAFLSPFHKAPWSRQRSSGVSEIFRDAGYAGNVRMHVLDQYAFQWDFLQEDQNNPDDVQTIVAAYREWQKYADSEFFRKFGHISYNISKYLTEWNCATGEIYHRMVPLFGQALKNKAVTAWVMANDYAATLALDYLKEVKVRVPEDLSIISFDNTLDAMEYQLTSYDFNLSGIVSVMLRYALRPSSVSSPRHKAVIEAEGTIIERRSTMRPAKGSVE
ncbi:MAG TPA: substrate-binding domain-containing protein [Chitinivibrionales bacterium]|nr:substrate-binding domain-containing protein [Chitinivibrionales bacterium]